MCACLLYGGSPVPSDLHFNVQLAPSIRAIGTLFSFPLFLCFCVPSVCCAVHRHTAWLPAYLPICLPASAPSRRRQAWGTGISPRLPRCLNGELKFTMHSKRPINGVVPVLASGAGGHATVAAAAEEEAHGPDQSAARTIPLLALLALLVVAAAVAAAVGRARQQRGGRRRLSGGLELLASQQVPHLGRGLRPEGEAEAAPLVLRNQLRQATLASVQRRARVRRQLQQVLAGRSGGIELLQLPELHAVLAHNLEGGHQSAAEHSGSSGGSSLEHLSRQWGLCTDSLRLQPGELEVRTEHGAPCAGWGRTGCLNSVRHRAESLAFRTPIAVHQSTCQV